MHLILRYPNGHRADALLLTREDDLMRVVLRGRNETLELDSSTAAGSTRTARRVSIEAMLADPYQGGRQTNTKYTTAETTPRRRANARRLKLPATPTRRTDRSRRVSLRPQRTRVQGGADLADQGAWRCTASE